MDFAGPRPPSRAGNRYILVCVEHLTGWPIVIATKTTTPDVVILLLREEVRRPFGTPSTIVSDNATCFTARAVTDFTRKWETNWKTVLAYVPMSNGRLERMV